jgi:pSer/pThr/pTyr-binding forkhead associated (FHA) protein
LRGRQAYGHADGISSTNRRCLELKAGLERLRQDAHVLGRLTTIGSDDPRTIVLESGSVTFGRDEGNQIVLDDESVSRVHARLDCTEDGVSVSDLGSTNGTLVNGDRVSTTPIGPGDQLAIGGTTWRFEAAGPPAPVTGVLPTLNVAADLETAVHQTPLATIVADLSQPTLVLFDRTGTRRFPLDRESMVIGREHADITIDDPAISRHHARVQRAKVGFELVDLDSRNGTFVADQRVERRALHDGDTIVLGETRLAFKAGHPGLALGASELEDRAGRRPVVVVPGMMGSQLWRGSERLWPNVRALFERGALMLPDTDEIEARGIVDDVVVVPGLVKLDQYNRLGSFLCETLGYERGKDLLEYAYDWRQDVRDSARRLAATIEDWRERSAVARAPITIVAHSLGCLVTRYFVERCGGSQSVDRLVLLGGPQQGVPQAIPMIVRGHKLLPFGLLGDRVHETISSFPSVYQILPVFPCARDETGRMINVLEDDGWVPENRRPMLREVSTFRKELGRRSSVPTVCVFGYGLETVTGVNVRAGDGTDWKQLDVAIESRGDEAIPEMSAVLDGADIHPVRQHHGSLYTDNDVKMRLMLELTRGVRPGRT